MLEFFITSKTKRKILRWFLTHQNEKFYLREVVKLVQEPYNAVRRELQHLERAGLLISNKSANLKYYEANKNFLLYPELKRIIYLTNALGDNLREKLDKISSIELAFIYGSTAKDEDVKTSDIDLLIVGEIDEKEFHKFISEIEKDLRREINYVIMSSDEFNNKLEKDDPFIKRVMKEDKIVLKGNPDVYRKYD